MPPEPDREKVLVDTPVLNRLEQTNLPFKGERRQEFIKQLRAQVRQRRTTAGVATRISNLTVGTVSQMLVDNVQGIAEKDIERRLDKRLNK